SFYSINPAPYCSRKEPTMKFRIDLHQELRQRILELSGVTERQNTGIHEDAFFVGGKCSCTSIGMGTATFNCPKAIRNGFSQKAKHAHTDGRRKQDTSRSS